jgi:hypothetical protein
MESPQREIARSCEKEECNEGKTGEELNEVGWNSIDSIRVEGNLARKFE